MKVKDFKNWKRVVFNDRVILKSDLSYLSACQRDALLNAEVLPCASDLLGKCCTLYVR